MVRRRLVVLLLSLCLLAAGVLTWVKGRHLVIPYLQLKIASSVDRTVQVYFDIGHGYRDFDSSRAMIGRGDTPQLVQLWLPAQGIRSLRLDPIVSDGTFSLSDVAIVDYDGKILQAIDIEQIKPVANTTAFKRDTARRQIVATAGVDPVFQIDLPDQISFQRGFQVGSFAKLAALFGGVSLMIFGVLNALMGHWQRGAELRNRNQPKANLATLRLVVILLSICLLAAAALTWAKGRHPVTPYLQLRIASSIDSIMQVYFDLGQGYRNNYSSRSVVGRGDTPQLVRLRLPAQGIRSLRLDPIASRGSFSLSDVAIVDYDGAVLKAIDIERIRPVANTTAFKRDTERGQIAATVEGDPVLQIDIPAQMSFRRGFRIGSFAKSAAMLGVASLMIFSVLHALVRCWQFGPDLRDRHRPKAKMVTRRLVVLLLYLCLFVAAALTWAKGRHPAMPYLQLRLASSVDSAVKVFFDLGDGIREVDSSQVAVEQGDTPQLVRLRLPAEGIRDLRLDPITSRGNFSLSDVAIVDYDGAMLQTIDIAQIRPYANMTAFKKDTTHGQIVATARNNDPVLEIDLPAQTSFRRGFRIDSFAKSAALIGVVALMIFSVLNTLMRRWQTGITLRVLMVFIAVSVAIPTLVPGAKHNAGAAELAGSGKKDLAVFETDVRGQRAIIPRGDGLELTASIYHADPGKEQLPAIILLHGNYYQGHRYPLYLVMGPVLAKAGYYVLAIDFVGFGASNHPYALGSEDALALEKDVAAALAYLKTHSSVDTSRIYIVGHSLGAGVGMNAAVQLPDIKKVVSIGPPRRLTERLNDNGFLRFTWRQMVWYHKMIYNTVPPPWVTSEVIYRQHVEMDISRLLPYFSRPGHKPLLFIDGENELWKDLRYLREYHARSAHPKRYVTLRGADHDCRVTVDEATKKLSYAPDIMDTLVQEITTWLDKDPGPGAKIKHYVRTYLERI